MKARLCKGCGQWVEVKSRWLDICPACSSPLKGPAQEIQIHYDFAFKESADGERGANYLQKGRQTSSSTE